MNPKKQNKIIEPIGDNVLVLPVDDNRFEGLYAPEHSQDKPSMGTVVGCGEGRYEDGKLIPIKVKKGNFVVYNKFSASEVFWNEKKYLFIKSDDVLAIIK